MKLELFPEIRNRKFVMGLYNKGPFTLPPVYWQDNFDLQIKVLEPDTDGGFGQQQFNVVDVTPLTVNVAVGLAADPKASTMSLTKDETNDVFTGSINLNTTEMETAINAASRDYIELFFEVEIVEGTSRTSIKQPIKVYTEVLTTGAPTPTDYDPPSALYTNLVSVLSDSDNNDVEGDGTNIKIWGNDTDWQALAISAGGETDIDPTDAKAIHRIAVALTDSGSPYNHRLVLTRPTTTRQDSQQIDMVFSFPASRDPGIALFDEGALANGSDDAALTSEPIRGVEGQAVTKFASVVWDDTNDAWTLAQLYTLGDQVVKLEGVVVAETLASNVATIDFDGEPYRTVTLAGDTTFNTISRPNTSDATGRAVSINIASDGSQRSLTFESGWNWICDKPTTIAASSKARLCLEAFGPNRNEVWASYKLAATESGGDADSDASHIGSGTLDDVTAVEQYSWGSQAIDTYTLVYLGGSWYDGASYHAGGAKVTINYSGGSFTLPAASGGTTILAEVEAHGYLNEFTTTGVGNITADFADAGSYGDNINQTRKPNMALILGAPIVPAMTANSDASHVASASDEVTNYDAYKAFDRDYSNPNGWSAAWTTTEWLQIQLNAAEAVNVYTLSSDVTQAYPIDWLFQGSNDGSTWFTLHEKSGEYWDSPETKVYEVPAGNRGEFLYYRWFFTDAAGSSNVTISNAQLY